jgi:ribonuclease HIII
LIIKIGKKIKAEFQHHIIKINPKKYNELYAQFKNLNSLLAWGHAATIEQLVQKTNCRNVIIDQFANENVVITALMRKKMEIKLTQRHRAEEDLIVAAASILARQTFLESLEQLGKEFDIILPKGASAQTIAAAKTFVRKHGKEALPSVAKMHFKTLESVLNHG